MRGPFCSCSPPLAAWRTSSSMRRHKSTGVACSLTLSSNASPSAVASKVNHHCQRISLSSHCEAMSQRSKTSEATSSWHAPLSASSSSSSALLLCRRSAGLRTTLTLKPASCNSSPLLHSLTTSTSSPRCRNSPARTTSTNSFLYLLGA